MRTPYNYDRDEVSFETGLACEDPSLAIQSDAIDADINEIVRRFGVTGTLPQVEMPPTYGDFEGVVDYHTAMNLIADANSRFLELPADVRAKFENDPGKFVAFCSDEKNLAEMRELGLAIPERMMQNGDPSNGNPVQSGENNGSDATT